MGAMVLRRRNAMKCLYGFAMVPVLFAAPVLGSDDPASLAIHLVASYEYLECEDLCPPGMTCEDVNCDLSAAELEASGGYGYAAFVAYNLFEVEGVEFYVVGWPMGPRTPDFDGPYYCPADARVYGEPFQKRGGVGGYVSIGCQYPCTGLVCLGFLFFGPSTHNWLPIVLEYAPSTYGYPSGLTYYDRCVIMQDIPIFYEHPAVIGGTCEPIPNCQSGPSATKNETWGGVKALYR
jgi:hypothetical protein